MNDEDIAQEAADRIESEPSYRDRMDAISFYKTIILEAIKQSKLQWSSGIPIKPSYFENVYGRSHKPKSASE